MSGMSSLQARRKFTLARDLDFSRVKQNVRSGMGTSAAATPTSAQLGATPSTTMSTRVAPATARSTRVAPATPSTTTPPSSPGEPGCALPPNDDAGTDVCSGGDHVPSLYDDYALGRIIGCGSFSTVRQATCLADGQPAAVKCVCSSDEEQIKATVAEYELMRALEHPSIVRARALYQGLDILWLVMDLAQGGSVEAYVGKHGALDEQQASGLSRQLFEAVGYLHQKRVVHRDVKPANILMGEDGAAAKLADFNSATAIGGAPAAEGALTFRGTRAYRAPELVLGDRWDDGVDVWACGLCLYFMLRSRLPFDAGGRRAIARFLAGELPEIGWGCVSQGMRGVVLQCLTVDMHRRPAAAELWPQLPVPIRG